MNLLLYLLILHSAGTAGGLLLRKFRLPAGALVGALLAAMLVNSMYTTDLLYPTDLRIFIQILSGLVIGTRFTRTDIRSLGSMAIPVVVLMTVLLATNLLFAFIMEYATDLSFMTSFFACAPGGVSDLALVAIDFGAVMEHVALLQLFRLITVILVFPPMIRKMLGIASKPMQVAAPVAEKKDTILSHLVTFVCALAGGMAFQEFSIPAGAILGAILAVALLNLGSDAASYPSYLKVLVQIAAGTYIGSKITLASLSSLDVLLVPALILLIELFFMAFVAAGILNKLCGLSWATALFSATPGGIQEMGLISDELGLETPKIVLMHTFRILAVLGVLPFIAGLFG